MNKIIAVALGLGLATSAFAQDARTVEYDSIDTCTGDHLSHQVFTPKSRGDSRVLDSIEFQTVLAFEAIDECREMDCGPDHGGGPTKLTLTACDRLTLLFSITKGPGSLETDVLVEYKSGPVALVCLHTEGGPGGGNNCSGQVDNAASMRAILLHDGVTAHDTRGQEEDHEQSPDASF